MRLRATIARPDHEVLVGVRWSVARWDGGTEWVLWLHLIACRVTLGIAREHKR